MEFEAFFLTVIAANAVILSCLAVSAWNAGIGGWLGWRISYTLGLLVQVRVLTFLGKPTANEGPTAIEIFPTHFAVLFWMLAGSVALSTISLRRRTNPAPTLGLSRVFSWCSAAQLFLLLIGIAFAGYGALLLLQEPENYGFSDIVIIHRFP